MGASKNRSLVLLLAAVIYAVFGIGLLAAPNPFMAPYGLTFDASGELLARVAGASLIGFAIPLLLCRGADTATLRPLMIGGLVYNLIDLPLDVWAVQTGVMNALGWLPVALHVFLAAGFAGIAFSRDASS